MTLAGQAWCESEGSPPLIPPPSRSRESVLRKLGQAPGFSTSPRRGASSWLPRGQCLRGSKGRWDPLGQSPPRAPGLRVPGDSVAGDSLVFVTGNPGPAPGSSSRPPPRAPTPGLPERGDGPPSPAWPRAGGESAAAWGRGPSRGLGAAPVHSARHGGGCPVSSRLADPGSPAGAFPSSPSLARPRTPWAVSDGTFASRRVTAPRPDGQAGDPRRWARPRIPVPRGSTLPARVGSGPVPSRDVEGGRCQEPSLARPSPGGWRWQGGGWMVGVGYLGERRLVAKLGRGRVTPRKTTLMMSGFRRGLGAGREEGADGRGAPARTDSRREGAAGSGRPTGSGYAVDRRAGAHGELRAHRAAGKEARPPLAR